jgi:ABC-type uncharacterized transport system auxiliary subunit
LQLAGAVAYYGRLAVTAELFDLRQRQPVARRSFEAEASVAGDAAAAVAAALPLALTQVLNDPVPWLEESLGPVAGRAP